jgi:hypothetical protein
MPAEGPTPSAPAAATAWVDYERPLAAVRAVFFDVDLAVRGKIHRGMRLQWLAREGTAERRLRQQTRVLDRIQSEDVVIGEVAEGGWEKRFVDGPNAGTRFVAAFDEVPATTLPEGAHDARRPGVVTRVTMQAFVGPRGFAQGLGKLSPLGLEKAMKRLMNEYKAALEGYEPGRARGAVIAALADARAAASPMRALDEPQRKKLTATLLEAAWAIACVDEGPDEAERDALRAIVASIWRAALDPALEERMVQAAVAAIAKDGAEARCAGLGQRLRALGFAELGLSLAVLVAEVSHGLDPSELDALRTMATAAGLDELALVEIIERTNKALGGGEPASRMSNFV